MPGNSSVMPGMKTCVACGADVSGTPRMKDSHGKYWCVPCGEADQKKKALTATHLPCAACRKSFAKGKLHKHGEYFFCKACLKKRTAAESRAGAQSAEGAAAAAAGATGGSPAAASARKRDEAGGDRKRVVILAAVLVVLVLFSLLYNFVLLD